MRFEENVCARGAKPTPDLRDISLCFVYERKKVDLWANKTHIISHYLAFYTLLWSRSTATLFLWSFELKISLLGVVLGRRQKTKLIRKGIDRSSNQFVHEDKLHIFTTGLLNSNIKGLRTRVNMVE